MVLPFVNLRSNCQESVQQQGSFHHDPTTYILDELLQRQEVVSQGMRPAEKRHIVRESFGKYAVLCKGCNIKITLSFAQLLSGVVLQ